MQNGNSSPCKSPIFFQEITPTEAQKLAEFRTRVNDALYLDSQKEDAFLIRWLRARNLDLNKAEEMLRTSLKWRKEKGVDTITETLNPPEELAKNAPVAFCGLTEEGYGIFVVPFGRQDIRYALDKYGLEKCQEYNIYNMEKLTKLAETEGKKVGKNVTQIVEIMDCEGYSYRQMASRTAREFMITMNQMMDANYPELLRYAMIVNAPKIFALLFAMLKPFIPKNTLDKIEIFGPDQEKWRAVVREKFPCSQIPPYWGGTKEGVDEFCSGDEIWIQGPKDMRAYMSGLTEADSDFHKVTISARDSFKKEIPIAQKNTIIEWKFKTDNHDIAFSLSSPQEEVVPSKRVEAHTALQEGSHVCDCVGTYTLTFDNSFSVLKAKTLFYQITMIDADHQERPDEFEDVPDI